MKHDRLWKLFALDNIIVQYFILHIIKVVENTADFNLKEALNFKQQRNSNYFDVRYCLRYNFQ